MYKRQLQELDDEVFRLEKSLLADEQIYSSLKEARTFEQLRNYSMEQLIHMSNAAGDLEEYYGKEAALMQEIKDLEAGTLVPQLKEKKRQLEERIQTLQRETLEADRERIARVRTQANVETEDVYKRQVFTITL